MQGELIPVTLVLGLSTPARAALLQALQRLQSDESRWAWLVQDLAGTSDASISERPESRVQLSNACVCCLGQAELQVRLPRLLQVGPWKRLVIELAAGSHPARVIDFLRSKSWNTKLDVQQVLLAIDTGCSDRLLGTLMPNLTGEDPSDSTTPSAPSLASSMPMNASALQILSRAQLMACTHLVGVELDNDVQVRLLGALSKSDWFENLVLLNLDQRTLASQLTAECLTSPSENQEARTHTSSILRTDDSNTLHFDLRWSPSRLFDRRRVMTVLNTFSTTHALLKSFAVFATERAWYEWRVTDSEGRWCETEYRVCSLLRIRAIDSIAMRERLNELSIAIEQTIVN